MLAVTELIVNEVARSDALFTMIQFLVVEHRWLPTLVFLDKIRFFSNPSKAFFFSLISLFRVQFDGEEKILNVECGAFDRIEGEEDESERHVPLSG